MIAEITDNLLTKEQAAELLGVSLATFDRARKRLGLRPVQSVRVIPKMFRRGDVLQVRSGQPLPARPAAKSLPSMRQLKNGRGK